MKNLVIVESPSKSKTIGKYLGPKYKTFATIGHMIELPSKSGSVDPEKDFDMHYVIKNGIDKNVKELVKLVKDADTIYLCSDPDREGEAISWSVLNILEKKKIDLSKLTIKRAVFHEITPKAVKAAIEKPRDIDINLVESQRARLSLDYLVGFTLSPVLWKKLPGSKSAGRVQSVALKIIVDREKEIRSFKKQEYWTLSVGLKTKKDESFRAKLFSFNTKKIDAAAKITKSVAENVKSFLEKEDNMFVSRVEDKDIKQNAPQPFTTSSLQQEASRRLNFAPKKTMGVAQKLYEGINIGSETSGLITYMRTDGMYISDDAISSIRDLIKKDFGDEYLPAKAKVYKTKVANVQEAHEAIRPTNIKIKPNEIKDYLSDEEYKLYNLIWTRTVACQMNEAILSRKTIDISSNDGAVIARVNNTIVKFNGYMSVYKTDIVKDDEENNIPLLNVKDVLDIEDVLLKQHFTLPPPRYTEASLIKKLEELGIGRPSTYVSTISVIQSRDYVELMNKYFHATPRGFAVSIFLEHFFSKYVDYNFTASMEEGLDKISNGEHDRISFLKEFWKDFNEKIDSVNQIGIKDVIDNIQNDITEYEFGKSDDDIVQNQCEVCNNGNMRLLIGRLGPFFACNNENCSNKAGIGSKVSQSEGFELSTNEIFQTKIGDVVIKKGPYGKYLESKDGEKIKRVSIEGLKLELNNESVDFLISLPTKICDNSETGKDVKIGIGRFGTYLLHDGKYTSIKNLDIMEVAKMNSTDISSIIAKNNTRTEGKKFYKKKKK